MKPEVIAQRLQQCAQDPMWANHAEVSKLLLSAAAKAIIDLEARAVPDDIEDGAGLLKWLDKLHAMEDGGAVTNRKWFPAQWVIQAVAAGKEFLDKTAWVHDDKDLPPGSLGSHIADVMTAEITLLRLQRGQVLALCAEAFCHDPMGQKALDELESKIKAVYGA